MVISKKGVSGQEMMSWRPNAPVGLYLSGRGGTFQLIDLWDGSSVSGRQQTLHTSSFSALAFPPHKWRGDVFSTCCAWGFPLFLQWDPLSVLQAMSLPCRTSPGLPREKEKGQQLSLPTLLSCCSLHSHPSWKGVVDGGSCVKVLLESCLQGRVRLRAAEGVRLVPAVQDQCWGLAASFSPPRDFFLFFLFPI